MDNLIKKTSSFGQIVFIGSSSPSSQNSSFSAINSGEVNGTGCAIAYAGGNDGSDDRTLNAITVLGSNDGSTWTTIGSTEPKTVPRNASVSSTEIFDNVPYKYYQVQGVASNMVSCAATLVVFRK